MIHYELFSVYDFICTQVKFNNLKTIQWMIKNMDLTDKDKVYLFEFALKYNNLNIMNWLYKECRYILDLLDNLTVERYLYTTSIHISVCNEISDDTKKVLHWLKQRKLLRNVDPIILSMM
jgi:hypothetical protein